MPHTKPANNSKASDLKIETVEEPAKSTVNEDGQIPPKGQKIEKRLKEAVKALDAPSKN